MMKVTVIGPQSVMDKAIRELHRLRVVHITDHQKGELDIGSPFQKADKLSELLTAARAVSSALGISGKKELSNGFRAVGVKNMAELEKAMKKLKLKVSEIADGSKAAADEIKKISLKEQQLASIQKLGLSPDAFSGYRSISHFFGTVTDAQRLRESLLAVTDKFELFSAEDKGKGVDKGHPLIALFIESGKRNEAADLLASQGFAEIQLSEIRETTGSVVAALEAVAKKKERLQKQVESGRVALARLAVKWNDFLLLSEQLISGELEKAEAPLKFAVTKNAFIVQGWVPLSALENLESNLGRVTGERIFVEAEPPHHGEPVPVKLDNPKPARPFEFFMSLYALPRYDEIDPTLFMFVTFPLFFGLILGDVGYGLVTFFLLLWLKEKMPGSAKLVNVIVPAAVASVFFGFLFGEVFGFEGAFGFEFPHLISRTHDVNGMLLIAFAIGLLHINLGFVLGFLNELRHKGLFRAFAAKLSWIILQVGVALVALAMAGKLNIPVYVGIAVAVASVILIYIGESMRGMVEIPGLLSNLMSYTRLAAVGLSSVELALVINGLAGQVSHSGAAGIAFGVLILFIGHTINLALGLLGSFLHSMRLHYVEFFTKFFEGGAFPFRPFGSKTA